MRAFFRMWPVALVAAGCAKMPVVEVAGTASADVGGPIYQLPRVVLAVSIPVDVVEIKDADCGRYLKEPWPTVAGRVSTFAADNGPLDKAASAVADAAERTELRSTRVAMKAAATGGDPFASLRGVVEAPDFTGKVMVAKTPIVESRSEPDPSATFAVRLPTNAAREQKVTLSWTPDGILSKAGSSSSSVVMDWVSGALTLAGKVVGSAVGLGGMEAFRVIDFPKGVAEEDEQLLSCIRHASSWTAARTRLDALDVDAAAREKPEVYKARRAQLEADALEHAMPFTGKVTKKSVTVRCEVTPPKPDGAASAAEVGILTWTPSAPLVAGPEVCMAPADLDDLSASPVGVPVPAKYAAPHPVMVRVETVTFPRKVGSVDAGKALTGADIDALHDLRPTAPASYRYRIPATAVVKVGTTKAGKLDDYVRVTMPIPQFGQVEALPMVTHAGAATLDVALSSTTGRLESLAFGVVPVKLDSAATAAGGAVDTIVAGYQKRLDDAETKAEKAKTEAEDAKNQTLKDLAAVATLEQQIAEARKAKAEAEAALAALGN